MMDPSARSASEGVRLTAIRILSTVLNHDSEQAPSPAPAAHADWESGSALEERLGHGRAQKQKQKQPQQHPAVPLAHTYQPAHADAEGAEGRREGEGEGLGWHTAKREALQRHVACAERAGIVVHWGWAIDGLREVRGRVREPVERTGQGADGGTADEVEGASRVEEHGKELEGRERLGQEGEYDDQEDEEEYEGEEEEVEMHFTNGHTARASFVVGFDGLHSSVRVALFGAEAPKFTGIV